MGNQSRSFKVISRIAIGLGSVFVLAPMLILAWFRLFGGDFEIALPHGYHLVRTSGYEILLDSPAGGIVVGPNISGYLIVQDKIIGFSEPPDLPEVSPGDSLNWGYFVVDLNSGEVRKGMSPSIWLLVPVVRDLGLERRLHSPSRWDNIFGIPQR